MSLHHNKEEGNGEVKFLYSIAISIAAILLHTYRCLEKSTGLVGSIIRRISPVVSYITPKFAVRLIRSAGISVVSIGDDYVLLFVWSIVVFSAPSEVVVFLAKIGCGVEHVVEKLPEEFENAVDGFPLVVRRVLVFGWTIALMLSVLLGGECWFAADAAEEEVEGGGKEEKMEMKSQKIWRGEKVVVEKNIPIEATIEMNVKTPKKVMKPMTVETVETVEREVGMDDIPILDFFEEGWHARPLMKIRK